MKTWISAIALLLASLGTPALGAAQTTVDCSSPQAAAETWLGNLQADSDYPDRAIECFAWDAAGVDRLAERKRQARQLLAVFDSRGYRIDVEALPATAEVDLERFPQGEVRFHHGLPSIFMVRQGEQWIVSERSVRRIPGLYSETFSVDLNGILASMPEWTKAKPLFGVAIWQVLFLAGGVLLAFLLHLFVVRFLSRWAARLIASQQRVKLEAKALERSMKPLGTLAAAGVLSWIVPLLRFGVRTNQILNLGMRVLGALAAVLFVYRLVDLGAELFARRAAATDTKLDDQIVPLLRKALKVVVIVLGLIFVLQNMDVDVGSLLAGVSLGGLAFTLAAKDTVANLFGSVSIFADQPFQVGDWVKIEGVEGVVEEVGMRSTRIRTFYNSVVSIPNSVVANASVDNFGRRDFRRCMVTLGVTYDTSPEQLQAFVEGIRGILKANEHVRQDSYEVHFKDFGASSLDILVYFFFKTDSWSVELAQRQVVFLEIMRLAKRINVDFAYPTQTLHLETRAATKDIPARKAPSEEELAAAIRGTGPGGELRHPVSQELAGGYYAGEE